ncbi:MAG: phage tail protein [Saprospiraceae bacterium]|nr:phage tail protein [Saprospiraceae bacterium]
MEGFFMAQVMLFAGNFAPLNWQFCQGQLISISENDALFSLLGTTFGGDGVQTFGLPDLRGRVPMGTGQGQGLSNYVEGEMAGSTSVTLLANNLPSHTHAATMKVAVSTANGNLPTPVSNIPATSPSSFYATAASGAPGKLGGVSATTDLSGSNQPVSTQQPYLAMNYVICMYGIYPSRS